VATWIALHKRTFAYFGGVPKRVIPDNLLCKALHNKFYVKSFIM
jgi:transposase